MPQLTVTLLNVDSEDLRVDWHECKVKIQNGVYDALSRSSNIATIPQGSFVRIVYNATFPLNINRRYRIEVSDWSGSVSSVIYYPSSTTWTTGNPPAIRVRV